MKKYLIGGLALVASISLAACDTGEESATAANDTSTTTTEEVEEVDIKTVESAFAVSIGHRSEKIEDSEPNSNIVIEKVDCSRTSEGKAICYVNSSISIGGYSEPYNAAWNVTYDIEDGHPLAYRSR